MPNWCASSYVFFGDKEVLKRFATMVENAMTNPLFAEGNWKGHNIINIFLSAGYTRQDIENRGIYMNRGHIVFYDAKPDCIRLDIETAWEPNLESFAILINEHFYGIDFVCEAEEPGSSIYINTDTSGKFFTDRFYITAEIYHDNYDELFSTEDDALEFISDITNKSIGSIKNFIGNTGIADVEWGNFLAAIGCENGSILVYKFSEE